MIAGYASNDRKTGNGMHQNESDIIEYENRYYPEVHYVAASNPHQTLKSRKN